MSRAILLLLVVSLSALGQNISGSLSGTVQDSSGAAFAGAQVKLSNTETGFLRTARTNMEGFFSFPDLTPGTYDLEITGEGFKHYRQEKIPVNSGDSRSTGAIKMELGAVTETLTVSAETTAVSLGGSERVGVLDSEDIQGLALRGRDFMDAIGLLPGVVDTNESREAPNPNSVQGIYIAGARDNSKNITIDGVTNMDTGNNNATHSMPSMDSVQEVSVKMTNYGAENGRNSGGAINIITRGGGQAVPRRRGLVSSPRSLQRQPLLQQQAEPAAPALPLQHLQLQRRRPRGSARPQLQQGPEQALLFLLAGIPASTAGLRDHYRPRADGHGARRRFLAKLRRQRPHYRGPRPAGRRHPRHPVPRQRGPRIPVPPHRREHPQAVPDAEFRGSGPLAAPSVELHRASQRALPAAHGDHPRGLPAAPESSDVREAGQQRRRHDATLRPGRHAVDRRRHEFPAHADHFRAQWARRHGERHRHPLPDLVNDFKFGVSQNKLVFYPENPEAISRKATGINLPQWNPSVNPMGFTPNMTFSSVPNFADPSLHNSLPYYNTNTIFSIVENLTKIQGTHVIMAGLYWERTRKDQSSAAPIRGTINFNRNQNINPLDTNYAWATALMGYYNSYTEANAWLQGQYRFTNLEFYVKDQWRALPNLTLDYGVRFYHDMPQYDARNQLSTFIPSLYDPARAPLLLRPAFDEKGKKVALNPLNGAMYSQGLVGTFAPGVGTPAMGMATEGKGVPPGCYTLPALSYAPRFGFSWDPFSRTPHARTRRRGRLLRPHHGQPDHEDDAQPAHDLQPDGLLRHVRYAGRVGRPGHPRPQQRHLAVRPGKIAHGV